jgi:hypothetical protein
MLGPWWVVVTVGDWMVVDCGPLVVTVVRGLAVVELVVVMVGPCVVVEVVCVVADEGRPLRSRPSLIFAQLYATTLGIVKTHAGSKQAQMSPRRDLQCRARCG